MAEKSKWFDRRPPPELLIEPIRVASRLDGQQLRERLPAIWCLIAPGPEARLLRSLAGMTPAQRLARNLKVLLDLLRDNKDPLFSPEEHCLLTLLHRRQATPEQLELVQCLLNIYERYTLRHSLESLFHHHRCNQDAIFDPAVPGKDNVTGGDSSPAAL